MISHAILQLARESTKNIHDELLSARALMQLGELEQVCGVDSESTFAAAERLVVGQCDPVARVILACDLSQVLASLGRDPYRLLEFAKSTAVGNSIRAEIYIALVEAKLGFHTDRKLRWAEDCAEIQEHKGWLLKTQAAAARIQADAGNWNAARWTTLRIEDPLQQLASCCELALCAHEQGNYGVLDMLPRVDSIGHLSESVRAKCILTMTTHSLGLDASNQLRQLIEFANRLRDAEDRLSAGILLARVHARCELFNVASEFVNALPEAAQKEALLGMCQETAQAGNVNDTLTLANELMGPGYRDLALFSIVRSATNAGRGNAIATH